MMYLSTPIHVPTDYLILRKNPGWALWKKIRKTSGFLHFAVRFEEKQRTSISNVKWWSDVYDFYTKESDSNQFQQKNLLKSSYFQDDATSN